ncbi:MAG: ATP-binding protein [Pseudodesulfovibrio sp.]
MSAGEEDRYRLLVEELPVIIVEMLPDGTVSYANTAASDFFGFSMARFGGEKPEASFCVRQLEAIRDGLASTSREAPLTTRTSRVEIGGRTHWIEWNLRGRFDGRGEAWRYLAAGFDITDKKSNEERLLESREEAQAANKAKTEFLANMSHEIRTPLNGVMGMLQLLETTALGREQGEYVSAAVKSCERLTHLLSDILDLSRVEAGKMMMSARPFHLKKVVVEVCRLFELTAEQAHLRMSCCMDASIPEVLLGDKLRIQQVLNNLVGNALKFTRSGEVRLEVLRQLPPDHEQFRILFIVSDTGIGVPDEKIAALFSPFTQVSAGYTRQFEGAGLGLAICKRLVNLMGGNIAIDSEAGVGTAVAVSLPLPPVTEPAAERGGEGPFQASPAIGLRVMVAEDDFVNCYAVRVMLEQSGFRVHTAGSGREAIRLLGEHAFDVVLMDVQMPDMNGIEATEAIRRGEAGERCVAIPIVAMTAYAMPGDRERLLKSGMNAYVAKPLSKAALLDAMAEAITDAQRM